LVVSEHGAMEDITLFNPSWWNKLPVNYQNIIVEAFKEVVPGLEKRASAAQNSALDSIKKSGINVRVADKKEREKLRSVMFDKARSAYINRAKNVGKSLMSLYNTEYNK